MTDNDIEHLRQLAEQRGYRITRARHSLTVKIRRELYDECRTMLMIKHGKQFSNNKIAPDGAWPTLIEGLLSTWLASEKDSLNAP